MKRLIALICVLISITCLLAKDARAVIYIDINQVSDKAFPIAIVAPLRDKGDEDPQKYNEEFAKIVRKDLELMGMFRFIESEAFLEDASKKTFSATEINFASWAVLDVLALVKGWYRISGRKITVEARLFDVLQKKELTAKRYEGTVEQVSIIAHRFANEVIRTLTGEQGLFDTKIAFIGAQRRVKEVYTIDFGSTDVQKLTQHGSISLSPEWSKDGKSIFYTSFVGGHQPQLFRYDLDSRREYRLTKFPGMLIGLAMDPSRDLLATALTKDGNSEIYTIDLTGKIEDRLTRNADIDVSASFSPDGKQMAFVSNRDGYAQIYRMNRDGSGTARLTFKGKNNTSPSWSPRGDKILFAGMDDDGHFDIFSINVDGSGMVRLTYDSKNNEEPSWAPHGELILFASDRTGVSQLYAMRPDGSHQMQLTRDNWDHLMPTWQPREK